MTGIHRALLGSATCHLLLISAFLMLGAGPATGPFRGVVEVFLVRPGGGDRVEAKRSIPRSPVRKSRVRVDRPPSMGYPIAAPLPLPLQETIAEEVPGLPEEEGPKGEVDKGDPPVSASEIDGSEEPGPTGTFPASERKTASISPAGSTLRATVVPGPDKPGGGSEAGSGLSHLRERIQSRIVYPEEAVRRGEEGEVLLRIRIGTGGVPREIRIARSSGARLLDEAARRGVVRAAPLPEGPGWVEVPIRFRLH
jgi:protein TonB